MSNKNPFEIRLELLKMAREYLDQQWNMNVGFAHQLIEKSIQNGEELSKIIEKYTPNYYSLDDVKKKAAELYAFVSDSSNGSKT